MDAKVLSDHFKAFAAKECKGSSNLYEHLSLQISDDEELLQIAAYSRHGQPVPNLFLGAVHYLLLKGANHELRQYYASIAENPRDPSASFPCFKDFCLRHTTDIISILQTKLVQTNEVRRCAYLYPCFCYIYEKTKKPLALIEIGTSAGLQLLWDQYGYSYHTGEIYGSAHSELHIRSEIRGERSPFLLKHSPPVTLRIGIDLHVNDVKNAEDYLWLKSLIWPEHSERRMNLDRAVSCLKSRPPEFVEGNGVKLLTDIISRIPQESIVCIFHTHVANQFSAEDKKELIARIQQLGEQRNVFHLYNNMWDSHLHLDFYLDGKEHKLTLAETDGHGRWFRWNN